MKKLLAPLLLCLAALSLSAAEHGKAKSIFDGKTFAGWEGDTTNTFRIEQGAIVGGSLKAKVPHNEFLSTARPYTNFVLRLKFKLIGDEKANGGVQFRSQRIPNHFEMVGYQADMGQKYWGCLYDESRRRKVLAGPDAEAQAKLVHPNDWNEYELRCEGRHIRLRLNGTTTVDYTETDDTIPQHGYLAVQIHGGPPSEAWYKDITIQELP